VRLSGGIQLGYCTNVSPGESLADVERSLQLAAKVRARLAVESLGLGLYLSHRAALEVDPGRLRGQLESLGLHCFTLNGFPFGGFHETRVKEAVYRPDWTSAARLEHTLRLAEILEAVAPADVAAPTISTVPLGWRIGWDASSTEAAATALVRLARELHERAQRGGRPIRVCVEPEPGCVVERTDDLVRFFEGPLAHAAEPGGELVRRHLGLCWDTCHLAVGFEEPEDVLSSLSSAGIVVGKVQVSSALEVREPGDPAVLERLRVFDEPRYLHQVRTATGEATDDLPEAIATLPRDHPWRVHFHVPIDREVAGPLGTTHRDLDRTLGVLVRAGVTSQYEVETYTWSVLPEAERPGDDQALAEGLAREVSWARKRIDVPSGGEPAR
jgi:sugar phosphate isomerase/epimerase